MRLWPGKFINVSRLRDAWKALTTRPIQRIGQPFASYNIINGQWVGIDDNKGSYITNGYTINDQLYSIINIILDKVRMPEWGTYKIVDEESLKSYLGIIRKKNLTAEDFTKALKYRTKALEPVSAGKLTELMKYPNEYETMQELAANSTGYKLLTGDRYIWGELLDGGANMGKPYALHCLPSQEVTIVAQRDTFPITEIGYSINTIGANNFTKQQVLHDKYWNPEWTVNGAHLYGLSPVKAALKKLTRNNSALKASGAMYQNQGVKGVLFVDDPRVLSAGASVTDTQKQSNAIKDLIAREWTGEDNAGKIGTSGYKMGWQSIGMSPVDLNIIESEKWDYIGLCNIYGVPPELLGLTAKTYNNMKEAETSLTSRCAMPQLNSLRESINRKLNKDWGYNGIFVDYDQTCFTELQEDVKLKSEWVNQLRVLSPNEQRSLLGLETIDSPIFDEPWIRAEDGVPLSEWQINDSGSDNEEDL